MWAGRSLQEPAVSRMFAAGCKSPGAECPEGPDPQGPTATRWNNVSLATKDCPAPGDVRALDSQSCSSKVPQARQLAIVGSYNLLIWRPHVQNQDDGRAVCLCSRGLRDCHPSDFLATVLTFFVSNPLPLYKFPVFFRE